MGIFYFILLFKSLYISYLRYKLPIINTPTSIIQNTKIKDLCKISRFVSSYINDLVQ